MRFKVRRRFSITLTTTLATLVALTACGAGSNATTLAATEPGTPTMPTYAVDAAQQTVINWSASADATSYTLLRNGAVLASGLTTTHYVDAANSGHAGNYAVEACNAAGCSQPGAALSVPESGSTAPGKVTSVILNVSALTLDAGSTYALTATVSPSNASNPGVTWSSAAPAIASVDASGQVTAIAEGSAVVTATTADGGFVARATITVQPAAIAVTGVTLAPTTLTLAPAQSAALTASVQPANATSTTLTWASSDSQVASVTNGGTVTCGATGSATITAATSDGHQASASVTCASPFAVFEFLKLKSYQNASGVNAISDAWFRSLGISPLNLIYSGNLVTCPLSSCTDQYTVDATKIATAAASADSTGATPVSLDLEVWDTKRFYPTTATGNGQSIVQNLSDALTAFKADNPGARVGLYAEVPQNTFGWSATTTQTYDTLNAKYAAVAALVDYYSPSLYNYGYDGTATGDANWNNAAIYAIDQSHAFDTLNGTTKNVLPYITPVWTDSSGASQLLTYDQMLYRLKALRAAGADGCVLWISSGQKDPATGQLLVIDTTAGWFKAVLDFMSGSA
ncbi:Ig-like domain-containing protein [Paraburkholderia sp. J67]|uniref:Ig-like domain-containing protein n=1 Tax=Paraburkholderia sp. J67 TaxID=2805435 RepID=UPI002ABD25D4|nr:Ig-like domain-containing protein [Paraburkholderia sp. J67]